MGGVLGVCLAHAGESVTLVVRREALANYPTDLHLDSTFGKFDVKVAVAAEVPAVDVLWLAMKAAQLEPALAAITRPEAIKAMFKSLLKTNQWLQPVGMARTRRGITTLMVNPALEPHHERRHEQRACERTQIRVLQRLQSGRQSRIRRLPVFSECALQCAAHRLGPRAAAHLQLQKVRDRALRIARELDAA